jgi:hypothetical protein
VSETQHDRELERYLQGNDPLSRAYDSLRDAMPSAELDRRILQEARGAVRRARRFASWHSYTAIAASVVLVFALVLRLDFGQRAMEESPTYVSAPAVQGSPVAPSDVRSLAVSPLERSEAAPLARSAEVDNPSVYTIQDEPFESKRANSQQPARDAEATRMKAEIRPSREGAKVGGGTGARLATTPGAKAIQSSVQQEVRADVPVETPQPAPAAPAAASSTAAAPEQERYLDNVVGTISVSGHRIQHDLPLAPEAWLQYIEQLRREGKIEEADEEMRRFKLAHPDYQQGPDAAPTR